MNMQTEQKKSKLKFFAAYFISVFLIIIIFATLWQGDSAASSRPAPFPAVAADENYVEADALLHKRMGELDAVYTSAIGNGGVTTGKLKDAEKALVASLDSLEDKASESDNETYRNKWQLLVSNFRTAIQARSNMMNKLAMMQQQNTTPATPIERTTVPDMAGTNATIEDLKTQLAKKDEQLATLEARSRNDIAEKARVIASLQEQVRRGPVATPRQNTSGAEEEWKKKYNAVKARHTELNTAYNTLSASYQSVVADNRRLLGQLQQNRKQ